MFHLLLEHVLEIIDHFKIFLGDPLSWLEKLRNYMG
jgi:hypothetical protein